MYSQTAKKQPKPVHDTAKRAATAWVDDRPEAAAQKQLQSAADSSVQVKQLNAYREMTAAHGSAHVVQRMITDKEDTSDDKDSLEKERAKLAAEHSWDGKTIHVIKAGEVWINANHSGIVGGEGQTGHTGAAMWFSQADENAVSGYGKGGGAHDYRVARDLTVAVLIDHSQVEPPDDRRWVRLFPHLDGAFTDHGSGKLELVVFDSGNMQHLETRPV